MTRSMPIATPLAAAVGAAPTVSPAQPAIATSPALRHYVVTIRRFDPTRGMTTGETFALPVDSPDEEHAIASTIANAASWPGKVAGGIPLPIAFMAVKIERR